jgi:hypothetical protein
MSETKWLGTSYSHPDEISAERWSRLMLSPHAYSAMVTERAERDQSAPTVGEMAPDFTAHCLSATGGMTGEQFRLSHSLGRPVGLIFGSYT